MHLPFGSQNHFGDQTRLGVRRLGVRRLGVNTVWGSEITLEFRGHFGSHFWEFFRATRRGVACSNEKKFSEKMNHSSGIRWPVANWYHRDASVFTFQQRLPLHSYRHWRAEQVCVGRSRVKVEARRLTLSLK